MLTPKFAVLYSLWLFFCVTAICGADKAANDYLARDILPGLMRFNRDGKQVSSDISEFLNYTCSDADDPDKTSCEPKIPDVDVDSYQNQESDYEIDSYIDGLAMYGGVNIAGALLLIVGTTFFLLGLVCLRLCQCCGNCTYKRNATSRIERRKRVIITTLCNLIFILLLAIVGLLGYFNGSTQLTASIRSFPEAASGFADLVQNEVRPFSNMYKKMFSRFVVESLERMNGTFTEAINFHYLYYDIVQVNSSLNNMPDFIVIRGTIDNMARHIDNVSSSLDLVLGDTEVINEQKQDVLDELDMMSADLGDLNITMIAISRSVRAALPVVQNISDTQTLLLGAPEERGDSTAGLMGSVYSDMSTLQQDVSGGYREFPDSSTQLYAPRSTYNDVLRGSYASIDTFLNNSMNCESKTQEQCNASKVELDTFVSDLLRCLDNLSSKPDYYLTSANLRIVESTIDSIDLDALSGTVVAIDNATSSGPTTEVLNLHLDNVMSAIGNISIADVRKHVLWIVNEVSQIPEELDVLLNEVLKIPDVLEPLREPLYDLLYTQPMSVNATLFNIDSFIDVPENETFLTQYFEKTNDTLTDLLVEFADVEIVIHNASRAVYDLNVSAYINDVDAAGTAIDDKVSAFNFSKVSNLINSFGTTMSPNLTSFENDVATLDEAINGTKFTDDMYDLLKNLHVANLVAIEQLKIWVGNGTEGVIGDLHRLEMGICSEDNSVYCDRDSDCAGSCLQKGEYRCRGNTTGPVQTCNADSQCTSTYCLADITRMNLLFYSLLGFAQQDNATAVLEENRTADTIQSMIDVRDGGNFDAEPTIDDLNSALDSINNVDLSSYFDDLDEVENGIYDIDLSSTTDNINSVSGDLDIDFSDFRNATTDAQELVDDFQDTLLDAFHVMDGVIKFFFDASVGLRFYLNQFDNAVLTDIEDNDGPGQMILHTGRVLDDLQKYWVDLLDGIENLHNDTTDVEKNLEDLARQMDIIVAQQGTEYSEVNSHGSLYYMLSQSPSTAREIMTPLDSSENGYVTFDEDEEAYEDDKYCLTDDCFDNTADYLENQPIFDGAPSQATFTNVAYLLWLPIAFVFILAVITACCPFVCCAKKPKHQYHPATFMLCCMVTITPWYLILPGILFPMLIASSDTCASYGEVGSKTLQAYGDTLCEKLGGDGSLKSCFINFDDDYTVNVTVNIEGIYNSVLGKCSGEDYITTPLYDLATSLETESGPTAEAELAKDDFDDIRAPLKSDMVNSAVIGGQIFAEFLRENADNVIDCGVVAEIRTKLDEPVCTYSVGPISWFVGMLYLAGWIMCCWGIPNACLIQHHCEWIDFAEKVSRVEDEDAAIFGLNENNNELDEPAFQHDYDEDGQVKHKVEVRYGSVEDGSGSDEDDKQQVSLPYVYGKSNIHYHAEQTAADVAAQHHARVINKSDYRAEDDDGDMQVELTRHQPASHHPSHRDDPHHLGRNAAHNDEPMLISSPNRNRPRSHNSDSNLNNVEE